MAGETLFDKIERMCMTLERMQIDRYLALVGNAKRMLFMAFLGGMARGVGFMFGFSTIGAAAVFILTRVVIKNIPFIGEFVQEVLDEVSRYSR